MPVGKDGRFTHPVDEYAGMLVFDANLHIIDHLKAATAGDRRRERLARHGAAAPRDLRPLLPALLALPRALDLQGRRVVVRRGDRGQAADGRPQPGDPLGARPHQGRPVRQVAGERPRLVDHPQPVLGLPGAGVEERRRGVPADRRLRLLRGDPARLRPAAGEGRRHRPAPSLRRRPGAPQPGRPDRQVDDAPGARRARRVVRLRVDARTPRCTTRSRTPSGSSTTSRATSSSSTSARPAAGSTRCTCWRPRSSTGRRSRPASATASCSAPTATRCRSRCATTPTCNEVFDRDGADAMRWFLMSSPILRGGNLVVTEQGIRDSVRHVMIPLWNSWYFFQLYANAANGGQGHQAQRSTDVDRPAGPLPAGQVPAVRRGDDRPDGQLRRRGGLRLDARVPRRADQLVHPALA